jgi:hypothetical protein
MEEEDENLKQAEEDAKSPFNDVTNEHTVEFEVDKTMTPEEFKKFTEKLHQ